MDAAESRPGKIATDSSSCAGETEDFDSGIDANVPYTFKNRFRLRLRLRTDIFKTTKSDPGSMDITKTEGLQYFDCLFFQPR